MAKGKSSATSGTRKKHARKAAGPNSEPPAKEKRPKGEKKGKAKEPRQKIYIPPVKPAPVQPDPLDSMGLARMIPPDLYIVLKSLGKKDTVTKIKALEGFQTGWVDRCKGQNGSEFISTISTVLPVWHHHLPSLFVHPSRRIRLSAAGIHASLLEIPSIRDQIFFFIKEATSQYQSECILGTWCMLAHDAERVVATFAQRTWKDVVTLTQGLSGKLIIDEALNVNLVTFICRALLDPSGMYLQLNPPAPTSTAPPVNKKSTGKHPPSAPHEKHVERVKSDEDEEDEFDKKARLRVGAIGALKWILDTRAHTPGQHRLDDVMELFLNSATWTSLHHAKVSPFIDIESFGYNQPIVRRAVWSLVHSLVRDWKSVLSPLLPLLSTAILRSAWVDPDASARSALWQPLLMFLKEFPNAWELDMRFRPEVDEHEEPSESEDSEEDEDGRNRAQPREEPKLTLSSVAFQEFLQFLQFGCAGSPLQGYPTVVIVLSTIPSTILLSSSNGLFADIFSSFWAAIDGRALNSVDRLEASAAFLKSLLECLMFLIRRITRTPGQLSISTKDMEEGPDGPTRLLVSQQLERVWVELSTGQLKMKGDVAGKIVTHTFLSLHQLDQALFVAAWKPIAQGIKDKTCDAKTSSSSLAFTVLKVMSNEYQDETQLKNYVHDLTSEIIALSLTLLEKTLGKDDADSSSIVEEVAPITAVQDVFPSVLYGNPDFAERLDDAVVSNAYKLLVMAPVLLHTYISHRADEEKNLQLWHALLASVAQHPDDGQLPLSSLFSQPSQHPLPSYLRPKGEELDGLVTVWVNDTLEITSDESESIVRIILSNSEFFLSQKGWINIVQHLTKSFCMEVEHTLHEAGYTGLAAHLDLMEAAFKQDGYSADADDIISSALPHLFLLAHLVPNFASSSADTILARKLLSDFRQRISGDFATRAINDVKRKLGDILADIDAVPSPQAVLRTVSECSSMYNLHIFADIFPPRRELDAMLDSLPSDPLDPSLAVIDDMVPPASVFEDDALANGKYDAGGLSSYARLVVSLVQVISEDRLLAKSNMWTLRHFLSLSDYANDYLKVPSARSPVFGAAAIPTLNHVTFAIQRMAAYLLSAPANDSWHSDVVAAILKDRLLDSSDHLGSFVVNLVKRAVDEDNVRDSRVLCSILQHVLGNATKEEVDQWLILAKNLEKKAPETSLAVLFSVTRYGPESLRLDRYRNELAAGLLGIRPSKINDEGLWVLRRLAAVAPDPQSSIVFLPQQRAVNVMKTCQQWITSDEDIDEDVENMMTLIFFHLAPLLQNVPGSHWEFVFDVIENNLENISFSDDTTLVACARTLRLIIAIQDLVTTNKALRQNWKEREQNVLTLLRNLVAQKSSNASVSAPRSVCKELTLYAVQDLPSSLMDQDTLSSLCHILTDPSVNVQKMAHRLLQEAAKKRTEYLVIEAGVDADASTTIELPAELVDIMQKHVSLVDVHDQNMEGLFGYLLGWMLAFDLFLNASLKVRTSYTEQLRNLNIISEYFIPNIFDLLNLEEGIQKAFKLDIWSVDEFYVSFYESGIFGLRLLAAHLYYRALLTVPSLIRSWVLECKDRQLSSAAILYTSQHFSPVIIKTELANVKSPEAATELADENLTIKVNSLNEVIASYLIDEQQLEIALKLPPDWPLHAIEVRDIKKVGVTDNIWRAWVLGVYKWCQNGHIVDALSLFKKNVTGHFEGQVECAICYSIISVVDYSLPKVPCKTCKNRFHSACLYKWFNTSHTSSCPLCRSDIR